MNSEEKNARPGAELSENELKDVSGGIWVNVFICPNCHNEERYGGPGPSVCPKCRKPWSPKKEWLPDISE